VREGETIEDYRYPSRFYEKSLPGKAGKLASSLRYEDIADNVRAYFTIRGWTNQ
jgi:hypothetical protein